MTRHSDRTLLIYKSTLNHFLRILIWLILILRIQRTLCSVRWFWMDEMIGSSRETGTYKTEDLQRCDAVCLDKDNRWPSCPTVTSGDSPRYFNGDFRSIVSTTGQFFHSWKTNLKPLIGYFIVCFIDIVFRNVLQPRWRNLNILK